MPAPENLGTCPCQPQPCLPSAFGALGASRQWVPAVGENFRGMDRTISKRTPADLLLEGPIFNRVEGLERAPAVFVMKNFWANPGGSARANEWARPTRRISPSAALLLSFGDCRVPDPDHPL